MISRPQTLAIALASLFFLIGCDSGPKGGKGATEAESGLPTVQMDIGDKKFTLEVADRNDTREHGLMNRDAMPADHGMIFVFADEAPRGFWMKNTRIPLDILYVDSAGKVVSVKQMKPHDWNTVPSDSPAKYAIELNEGMAAKANAKPGLVLKIPATVVSKD
jgi:uncharacterized membrane protein (UPF0127 family)